MTDDPATGSQAPHDSPPDAIWRGLPSSNLYRQRKLTGWRDLDEEQGEDTAIEIRVLEVPTHRYAPLGAAVDAAGWDFDVVMLGAYHLVVQWYLDDCESLIGSCIVSSSSPAARRADRQGAMLSPSYVYAEDGDPVAQLLRDVAHQHQGADAVGVDADYLPWLTKRAPIFFYVAVDEPSAVDAAGGDFLSIDLQQRRVIVSPVARSDVANVSISMPSRISDAIGIDGFRSRYDSTLSLLLTGTYPCVGEIKERLGKPAEVPYLQLEDMQRRVIRLWAKVLGTCEADLGESSNYYEVGGTSLNAFKLLNRVRLEFQRDISLWEIIENPTVQEFSRLLLKN